MEVSATSVPSIGFYDSIKRDAYEMNKKLCK